MNLVQRFSEMGVTGILKTAAFTMVANLIQSSDFPARLVWSFFYQAMDEFPEKVQTAIDPPPSFPNFSLQFFVNSSIFAMTFAPKVHF